MSSAKKGPTNKTSTSRRGAAVPPESPFRVVTASGVVTSPGPNTIIEAWQYDKKKKADDAAWHASVRQKIIDLVVTQPSQLSAEELHMLNSHKLAAVAVNLITMQAPTGPDPALPVESLLAELDQSAEKRHVKQAIRSVLAKKHSEVDEESLQAAMQASSGPSSSSTSTVALHVPASGTSSTSTVVSQSSTAAQASQQQPPRESSLQDRVLLVNYI